MNFCDILVNKNKTLKKFPARGDVPSSKQILKNTFEVAWFSVIEGVSNALIAMIDMAMVGGVSSAAISAIGLTNQPKFIALALFFAIGGGVIAIISRRFGQGDRESANSCLMQSFSITLLLSIIIGTIGFIFAEPIMYAIGAEPDTIVDSTIYLKLMMINNVMGALTYMINSAQRAIGKTSITFKTSLIANLVNVSFNYLLIGGNLGFPALGVMGAGIATIIGQTTAFAVAFGSLLKKDNYLQFQFNKLFKFTSDTMRPLFKLASSGSVEQICVRIGFLLFAITVAKLGTDSFSAYQIGMSMLTISFAIGDGLGIACSALVGQNLGKDRPDLSMIYATTCQRIGFIGSILISLVYWLLPGPIYAMFNAPPHVAEMGLYIMTICGFTTYVQVINVISSGALRGAGDVKFIAVIAFISITIIRPLLGYVLCFPLNLGLLGIWLAVFIDQFCRFSLAYIRFLRGKWIGLKI